MLALARRRAFRCLDLDQILDLEPAAAQRAHLVAVREMELDAGIARLLDPMHAERRSLQAIARRPVVLLHEIGPLK